MKRRQLKMIVKEIARYALNEAIGTPSTPQLIPDDENALWEIIRALPENHSMQFTIFNPRPPKGLAIMFHGIGDVWGATSLDTRIGPIDGKWHKATEILLRHLTTEIYALGEHNDVYYSMVETVPEKKLQEGSDHFISNYTTKISKHWWMGPDLTFYEVPFEMHREWAVNYLKRMGQQVSLESSDVYGMMYRYGFIHIVKVDYAEGNVLHYGHSKFNPLNHRQLAAIKDLAIEEGCKYISDTNTGREEELQESMFPKDFKRHNLGTCMSAAALATQYFLQKGIKDFKIVEGWVSMYPDQEEEEWSAHTWIEFKGGRKFDPTKKQWAQWGFKPEETKYERVTRTFTPEQYVKLCTLDGTLDENTHEENRRAKEALVKQYLSQLNDETIVVTVNKDPTFPAADFIQVDGIVGGQNIFSSNPEDLAKWGFKMPSTKELMVLPRGKYKLSDARKLLQRGLQENMTYDQLLKLTADTPRSPDDNTNRIDRSKNVRVRSIPVSVEEGMEQWNFRYRSDRLTGNPGEPLEGHITFLKGEVESKDQAADLECKVDCSCPDYMYRFAHNNHQQGAGDIGPDSLNGAINRSPKPAYDIGEGLCKHLSALGGYLKTKIGQTQKSNLFEAVSDVARQGPFNIEYYD